MRSKQPSKILTQVVVDGEHYAELAELQHVMRRIQGAVKHVVPSAQQSDVGNALLNLAVCRVSRDAGAQDTATVLIRLIDGNLAHEKAPPLELAIDLTGTHS